MDEQEYVHKKSSSEILFAEYGTNLEDGEEPTPENKRVIDMFDPVDSMSLNREKNRVVVSGIRGVLQVIKIRNSHHDLMEGPSIVKDLDMRVYRKGKVNILYSAQNVKWNQIYDQYIATTSSNGSIVCWNISRKNKSVYKSHERSATCLDWHANAPYILISGSRDCTVRSYDLRVKDVPQLTFRSVFSNRNCESVRDVAFSKAPGCDDYFFSGDDGGVLRLWDLRQPKKWIFEKVAHRSFVSTISLNPNNRMLLATGGGRDKMVKIWEWSGPDLKRISVVETTAPLGRVAWRPDKPYQLATCASVNETTVHVWDVRRPFLPYVTYDEHRDSVTDACWPSNDFDVFMSCGKDGLIVLHNIDSGHAPINYACDVAFDITPDGCMSVAVNSEIHAKNDAALEEKAQASSGKKTVKQIPYETFQKPIKSLIAFGVPESLTHSLPPTNFYQTAEKYLIGGMEIMNLCEFNSKIARKQGQEHVAQTWRLVEALCGQAKIQEEYDKLSREEKERIVRAWKVRKKELAEEGRRWLANLDDQFLDDVKRFVTERLENTQQVTAFIKMSSSSESDDPSEDDEREKLKENGGRKVPANDQAEEEKTDEKKKKKKKKNLNYTDFYFGAGESNYKNTGGKKEVLHCNEFMGLRQEAFELRDEEKEAKFFCKARKQPANAEQYEKEFEEIEAEFKAWSPMLEIYRLLLYHAEQGDMQTCATISMVCGKRLFDAVDPYTVNGWILCYMEMLNNLELYMVCAKIRKYCPLESISSVSRENTTIQLAHADCDALIVNGRCTKCEKPAQSTCTVCRFDIIGMTYQCHLCGHAMHADHAYEWFQNTTSCAFVGCLCTCGENNWPDLERTYLPNDDLRTTHKKFDPEEPPEETTRVEASRIDSDSDEAKDEQPSDEEWGPNTETVKKECNEPVEKLRPWEQHLIDLYTARYKMPPPEVEEVEEMWNPESLTKLGKSGVKGALENKAEKKRKELKEFMTALETEGNRNAVVDREMFMESLLDILSDKPKEEEKEQTSEETTLLKKRGNRKNKRILDDTLKRMELIKEEDEDEEEGVKKKKKKKKHTADDVSKPRKTTKNKKEVVEKEEKKKKNNKPEEISTTDPWKGRYGNAYIDSIGPIGISPNPLLERVTSPDFTEEQLEENLQRVRLAAAIGETVNNSDEDEKEYNDVPRKVHVDIREFLTEKEGKVKKEKQPRKEKTLAEKALEVLSMSKSQMKRKRAKRLRRKEKASLATYDQRLPYVVIDVSPDEFAISSGDDSVSVGSSTSSTTSLSTGSSASELFIPQKPQIPQAVVNEGYQPESEERMSSDEHESSSSSYNEDLDLHPDDRYPTPVATGDVYEKRPTPDPPIPSPLKIKKFSKVSQSVFYSSSDEADLAYAELIFIGIDGIDDPSTSSTPSPQFAHLPPSIPSSRESTPPISPLPPGKLIPLRVPPCSVEDLRKDPPPSRRVPKVVLAPPPRITSCANPMLEKMTSRRPRSKPVNIGHKRTNSTGSEPVDGSSATNLLFPRGCTSLPTPNFYPNGSAEQVNNVTEMVTVKTVSFSPEETVKLRNGFTTPSLHLVPVDFSSIAPEELEKAPKSDPSRISKILAMYPKLQPKPPPIQEEDEESDLFSNTEDEEEYKPSREFDSHFADFGSDDEDEDRPFFPITEGTIPPRLRHYWETEEEYLERLQKDNEEDDEEKKGDDTTTADITNLLSNSSSNSEKEDVVPELPYEAIQPEVVVNPLRRKTPMMRELEKRRKRKAKRAVKSAIRPFEKPMQEVKRVHFGVEVQKDALDLAIEKLKAIGKDDVDPEEQRAIREMERCRTCRHEIRREKNVQKRVQFLRDTTERNQIVFVKTFDTDCAQFQLQYLDHHRNIIQKSRKNARMLTEFIRIFYFIEWDQLTRPNCEFMVKEVYEMWQNFQKQRLKVCKMHYNDFRFKFFASSIATKIKQTLFMHESPQTKLSIRYDWLHLQPCVTTVHDDPEQLEKHLDTVVGANPNWSVEERKAASSYWNIFGNIPVHIDSHEKTPLPPFSENKLEIIDDTNYWTKKMLRKAAERTSRNYQIKLSYTKQRKEHGIFLEQKALQTRRARIWQNRLDSFKNETPSLDGVAIGYDARMNLLHTIDDEHPWPSVQLENKTHYIRIVPMVTKDTAELKSELRRKFSINKKKTRQVKRVDNVKITFDDLRKTRAFKKFEPLLKKAEDLQKDLAKYFKVVNNHRIERRHVLYTIAEEDEDVYLLITSVDGPYSKGVFDVEDFLVANKDHRDRRDLENLSSYAMEKYQQKLDDHERLEAEKSSIMRKNWKPALRKTSRIARKVMEMGRVLMEEDIQLWMEYQYQMSFAQKTLKKKFRITRRQMKKNVPMKWFDAVDKLELEEKYDVPSYIKIPPIQPKPSRSPENSPYNSSSSEDNTPVEREPEDPFEGYSTLPNLPVLAGKLQAHFSEQLDAEDNDEDWIYSDDSSVSDWFEDEDKDVINRLVNSDYIAEHLILKERARGYLARPLWCLLEERKAPEMPYDNVEYELEEMERLKRVSGRIHKKYKRKWLEQFGTEEDLGMTDGKYTKHMAEFERILDSERLERKKVREEGVEQLRYAFKHFALEHSNEEKPYTWNSQLHDPIAILHHYELARVGHRIHQQMKEEYDTRNFEEDMMVQEIPAPECTHQFKFLNLLLFGESKESFKDCKKVMTAVKKYEMIFGSDCVFTLKQIEHSILMCRNVRASFNYIARQFDKSRIPVEKLIQLIKLWWFNSKTSLKMFVECLEERLQTEEQIVEHWEMLRGFAENSEIIRDTVDRLEVSSVVNEMLFTVEQYVEDTQLLFNGAKTEMDRMGVALMDVADWQLMKLGYAGWLELQKIDGETEDEGCGSGPLPVVFAGIVSNTDSSPFTSSSGARSDSITNIDTSRPKSAPSQEVAPTPPSSVVGIYTPSFARINTVSPGNTHISPTFIQLNIEKAASAEDLTKRRHSSHFGSPNLQMMKHYQEVYEKLKKLETERKKQKAEEMTRKLLEKWENMERHQKWTVESLEKKVIDYLMMDVAVDENSLPKEARVSRDWRKVLKNGEVDEPTFSVYAKEDLSRHDFLELCGLPVSLDNQMFRVEMRKCVPSIGSISDADEMADKIEKEWEDLESVDEQDRAVTEIDSDAESYCSVENVTCHELYYQRERLDKRIPTCVAMFSPSHFFCELPKYEKWKRIIEAADSPFSFNRLVSRERILTHCKQDFRQKLIDQYLSEDERDNATVLKIFKGLLILVVFDNYMNPWTCRVVSTQSHDETPRNRIEYLQKKMVEDSQKDLITWLRIQRIDMEVYSLCPVIVARDGPLTPSNGNLLTEVFMIDTIREELLMLKREEGVALLDTMIRMPPPPEDRLPLYKTIFEPIYNEWYSTWNFENVMNDMPTIVRVEVDHLKEYMYKARMLINYAHQHYRMKRFDSLMAKDPTEFQMIDRSDVPSASLFDSLDAAVSKFCDNDSAHLNAYDRQRLKDALIQLATGKIPNFSYNYFDSEEYAVGEKLEDEEENDDDKLPLLRAPEEVPDDSPHSTKYYELETCEEEMEWLRSLYADSDWQKRRFMAVLCFELAQKSLFRFGRNVANFRRGQRKFQHLLNLHGKHRPLLDMMLTKVRGTFFMPLETNLFLYDAGLITSGELIESEIHPRDWKDRKDTLRKHRRQKMKVPGEKSADGADQGSESEESGSEASSDPSSTAGSTESLNTSKQGKKARKTMSKAQREMIILKMRSKPANPDEKFADEKRALGHRGWKTRRRLNDVLEGIADLDRAKLEKKLPPKKQHQLRYINDLICNYADTAHWSWGELKMKTKIGRIPPVHRMRSRHVERILKGRKSYQPPNLDRDTPPATNKKWF